MNNEQYLQESERIYKVFCEEFKNTDIYKEIINKSEEEQKAYRDLIIMAAGFTAAVKEIIAE